MEVFSPVCGIAYPKSTIYAQNLCSLHKPFFLRSGTDDYGMRHADRRANACRIIDALCGNFTARVRARRAGLERTVKRKRKTGEQNHFCERERKTEHKPGVQWKDRPGKPAGRSR